MGKPPENLAEPLVPSLAGRGMSERSMERFIAGLQCTPPGWLHCVLWWDVGRLAGAGARAGAGGGGLATEPVSSPAQKEKEGQV